MLKLNPKLLQEAFPINKVEVFFDAEDHSNFLGFTWEMISQGRVPVGLDNTDKDFNKIGQTGGEKTHTLTINEMPKHNHSLVGYRATTADASATDKRPRLYAQGSGSAWDGGDSIQPTGVGQEHNNLQPYIVMAFWKRVA